MLAVAAEEGIGRPHFRQPGARPAGLLREDEEGGFGHRG